jgi:hypothetical protein
MRRGQAAVKIEFLSLCAASGKIVCLQTLPPTASPMEMRKPLPYELAQLSLQLSFEQSLLLISRYETRGKRSMRAFELLLRQLFIKAPKDTQIK